MAKFFLLLFILVLALIVPRIIRLVQFMKFGKVMYQHQPGPCQLMKGIEHGAEDMQALPNGMVFISSGIRFEKDLTVSPWKDIRGYIMLYDVNSPNKGAVPLTIEGNLNLDEFNPHGISIWREKDKVTLFVINHPPGAELVERFSFDIKKPTKLKHEETIASENILFPNDLVAVGPRQFYITNYAMFHGHDSILAKIELYSMLHLASVAYFDGQESKIVIDGLLIANGINQSPDGKYIYVMSVGDEELRVYERREDNSLDLKQAVTVGAADNIDVDPVTGDLWLGVHPTPSTILEHFESPFEVPSSSQVLHLKTRAGLVTDVLEVYSEDGSKYVSASSVAVHFKNQLLVGSVCHRAAVCEVLYPQ